MPAFIEQFEILFKGLKTGIHHFSFELNEDFFSYFDNPDCLGGAVNIELEMNKKDHLISITCNFTGTVRVVCDRCLEEFLQKVNFNSLLFVKFGDGDQERDADVIWLEPGSHKLNLAEYFLESVCLSLPFKRVHQKDENGYDLCNIEMIKKLDEHRVRAEDKTADPRWDTLKNIMNKEKFN